MIKTSATYSLEVPSGNEAKDIIEVIVGGKNNICIVGKHLSKSIPEHIIFYTNLIKELQKYQSEIEKL